MDGGGFKNTMSDFPITGYKSIDEVLQRVRETEGEQCAKYVLQCIDPWHCMMKGCTAVSAPNETGEPCVPFRDIMTYNITEPVPFAGVVWSYQVQVCDSMYQSSYRTSGGRDQNYWVQGVGPQLTYGSVMIFAATGGNPTMQWSDGTSTLLNSFNLPTSRWTANKMKINAIAIKISDTTPELYRGGMAHSARHNQPELSETTVFQGTLVGSTLVHAGVELYTEMTYPVNSTTLASLPGYCQHEVPKGVLTNVIVDNFIKPGCLDYTHRVFQSNVTSAEPDTSAAQFPELRVSSLNANNLVAINRAHKSGLVPQQIYFNNLQPQHTSTMTVVIYSECYYSSNIATQNAFIPLLGKATPWSPKTLMVCERLQRDFPAMGVAADNNFGTWLAKVAAQALPDIADILSVIPHPIAQGLSIAARLGGNVAESYSKQLSKSKGTPIAFTHNQINKANQQIMSRGTGQGVLIDDSLWTNPQAVKALKNTAVKTAVKNAKKNQKKKDKRRLGQRAPPVPPRGWTK